MGKYASGSSKRIKNKTVYILPSLLSLSLSLVFLLSGCTGGPGKTSSDREARKVSQDIFAMDTYMTVTAYGDRAQEAVDRALEEIQCLDDLWSVGNPDSEVSRLNRGEHVTLSPETADLIRKAIDLFDQTGGAFDITIYPLMEAWGFTSGDFRVPASQEIQELLKRVDAGSLDLDKDAGTLILPEGMQIDLGGIAKGYTSARLMEIFDEYQVDAGLVSLGGNVQTYRQKPDGTSWKIAVENPDDTVGQLKGIDYAGLLELSDKAVITSGGYERFFEEEGITYHHILDPATGYPADSGLISVTIVSSDGCLADGLSTALFVMGEEKATAYWREHREDFDFILIDDEGKIKVSSGLEVAFSTELEFEVVE